MIVEHPPTPDQIAQAVAAELATERRRQVAAEGYSFDHDDQHADGSLALAAACYACSPKKSRNGTITRRG